MSPLHPGCSQCILTFPGAFLVSPVHPDCSWHVPTASWLSLRCPQCPHCIPGVPEVSPTVFHPTRRSPVSPVHPSCPLRVSLLSPPHPDCSQCPHRIPGLSLRVPASPSCPRCVPAPRGCFSSTSHLSPVSPGCPQGVLGVPGASWLSLDCPQCVLAAPRRAQQGWGHSRLSSPVLGFGMGTVVWGRPSQPRWHVLGCGLGTGRVPKPCPHSALGGTGEGTRALGDPGRAGAVSPSPQGPSRCPRGAPRWGRGWPRCPSVGAPPAVPAGGLGGPRATLPLQTEPHFPL